MTRKDIFGKLRLLPFFATFIIAGCTLMMDEVDEPEPEEVGFDEVATYENEYVTVNYQYQEGVKPVTENVLEYVVESDDPKPPLSHGQHSREMGTERRRICGWRL